MDSKILTIGIPTYNGSKTIRDAIDSVISQLMPHLQEKVDLLVSNNNSTDDTVQIVKEYIEKYPVNIDIINNERYELELDGNLINLFNNAKGKYVWILSDDDSLSLGAIERVVNIIESQKNLSLIFTNYSECDSNLVPLSQRKRDDIASDIFCNTGDEFIVNSKVLFGLISSLIIRTNDWNECNLKKYIGMNSLHVGAVIEILSENKSYIVSDKLVNLRTGNTSWGKNGTFIFPILNIVKMFKEMRNLNYSISTLHYVTNHFYRVNYKSIIRAKIEGLDDINKAFVEMRICYGHKISFWLVDFFILLIPRKIFIMLNILRSKLV